MNKETLNDMREKGICPYCSHYSITYRYQTGTYECSRCDVEWHAYNGKVASISFTEFMVRLFIVLIGLGAFFALIIAALYFKAQ